jgi:predicted amidohydrolase
VPALAASVTVGLLLGAEIRLIEQARGFRRDGVKILASPRATRATGNDRWLKDARAAAIAAGAFLVSSNRRDARGIFGGRGSVVGPQGELMAVTTTEQPFLTIELDIATRSRWGSKTLPDLTQAQSAVRTSSRYREAHVQSEPEKRLRARRLT